MEKKEKSSPFQDGKMFDPAGLLGASPFSPGLSALPFAHLAHLPGAFSMLGHPAFPVTSLFGRLGEGLNNPLGIPSSLASSLSPTSGPAINFDSILSPLLLSMGQGRASSDPKVTPSTCSTDTSAKFGLFSNSASSASPPKSSSSHETASRPSPPSSPTSPRGRGRGRGFGRGSRGGGGRGSRGGGGGGRGSRGGSRGGTSALMSSRGRAKKLIKQPPIPMSLVQSNSILSPSLLEKYAKKREANGVNGVDGDLYEKRSYTSSLFDFLDEKSPAKDHKPKAEASSSYDHKQSPKSRSTDSPDKVHIDSMKKKLIADQIRQKMQTKSESEPPTSPQSPSKGDKKGEGHMSGPLFDNDELTKDLEAEKKRQERIKRELELELRQQQIALQLMKEGSVTKHRLHPSPIKDPMKSAERKDPTKSAERKDPIKSVERKDQDKSAESADSSEKMDVHQKDKESDKEASVDKDGKTDTNDDDDDSDDEDGDDKGDEGNEVVGEAESKASVASSNQTSSDESGDSSSDSSDTSSSGSSSSSSSSSSESESENSGASDDEASADKPSAKRKLKLQNDSGRPIKRRHVVLDEEKIRVPLDKGWHRQTNIHMYGRRGIVGEVWYFAPCGKKMKTIPEVMRYIEKNCVTDLGRDHFSFNTKVNVGEFYEAKPDTHNKFVKLTDSEIHDRLFVTVSRRMKKIENQKKKEKDKMQITRAKQMFEKRMKQRMEHQEMARKVAEIQIQKRLERQQQQELLRQAKQIKLMEKRKQKDQIRLMREQERIHKEEQLRIKREIRAQQMMEKQKRREDRKKEKYMKVLKKTMTDIIWRHLEQEREIKRQQAALLKEQIRIKQEQERRRQHMMLLKALEQRKKQEEQRRIEYALAQELKKPIEDMEIRDPKPLPELERIQGNLLDGEPFANCLMTMEFLHNFSKVLGFDKETLPTLKSLQDCVLCKTEEDGEEYISLVMHLLQYALDDPGVPNPKEAVTKNGQKIVDLELTDGILSEILRIFMVVRNGGENELTEYLRNYPLEACSVTQRAEVLAFLCNELNCSRTITNEIENYLDKIADIRRDKWTVEGKLRRLRMLRKKKFNRNVSRVMGDADGEDSVMTSISKQSDDEEGSGNEEDINDYIMQDDDPSTLEELEKQMEKYHKQQSQHRDKVLDACRHVRAIDLGQDRYKRNYWILPVAGGVYVESQESADAKEACQYIKSDKVESKSIRVEVLSEKTEKKGVQLLEVIEEKKGVDILNESKKMKSPKSEEIKTPKEEIKIEELSDSKDLNEHKEIKCENGFVKSEKDLLEPRSEQVKSESENVVEKHDTNNVVCNGGVGVDVDSCKKSVNGEISQNKDHTESSEESQSRVVNDTEKIDQNEKSEKMITNELKGPQSEDTSGNQEAIKSPTKMVELKIPNVKSSAIESETTNLFLQVPTSTRLSEFCNIKTTDSGTLQNSSETSTPSTSVSLSNTSSTHHVTKSANHNSSTSPPGPQPPPAHSNKNTSEKKHSFMSIDSILEKKTGSSHQSIDSSVLPVNPFTSPHSKGLSDSQGTDSKPWFSILPRVPCDDMSLTRSQTSGLSSNILLSPPFMSQLPFHPFPLQSPTFASFQMGQLYNSSLSLPMSMANAVSTSSSPSVLNEESFKKPDTPVSSTGPDPLEVLKQLQGELRPIPEEYTKGWWKINEPEQLTAIQANLHPRGIREKNLIKSFEKFLDYAATSCTKGKKHVISLECSDEEGSEEEETDKKESKNTDETKDLETDETTDSHTVETKDSKTNKEDEIPDDPKDEQADTDGEKMETDDTTEEMTEETDKAELKEETQTDKTDTTKKTEGEAEGEDQEPAGDDDDKADVLIKTADKPKNSKPKKKRPVPVIDVKAKSDEADRIALGEVESLEDKVSSASLQIKGWKLAPKTYHDESEIKIISRGSTKQTDNDMYPVECAKERLLQLESNIERRYLKPPLNKVQKINLSHRSSTNHDNSEDNDVEPDFGNLPVGLQAWRIAVATATSPAQLTLCVMQLNNCIFWEKSIMKVLCQICRKDDNEAELLLCDGCDRGYHTYCFKPKMETVPEGDWYCYECVSKAMGESCCLVCGRRLGKMAECHTCNRCVHLDCLDPPLPRIPRKWFCTSCEDKQKGSKKRQRKSSTASNTAAPSTPTPTPTPTPAPSTPTPAVTLTAQDLTPTGRKRRSDFGIPRKQKTSETASDCDSPKKKKENSPAVNGKSSPAVNAKDNSAVTTKKGKNKKSGVNGKNTVVNGDNSSEVNSDKSEFDCEKEKLKICEESTDLAICRTILTEMMKHEDGWPFLQPVNCKHFPSYRKYIKQPMDFGTMKVKLRDHVYTKRSEFVHDVYLVFDNCKLFNEDDSEVGQCGHNMRKYVTLRWRELLHDEMSKMS